MNPNRKFKKYPRHDGQVLHALHLLYKRLQRIEKNMEKSADIPPKEQMTYRDRDYVLDRVGISDRTLLRFQRLGLIPVAKRIKGKCYYYEADIERFRRYYWDGSAR
ncbi:MerR family transcriptional regulator [Sphingobacterium faecale]|uniref:Helix-turn-helix domain-containing protein n=1 Tax=Sphingobacterium faecale TaxID=2803775 RepID=A0ABS1QZZ8_9SPHI|nr:hypothetical protein [Sphingobacterium faecale]MBL1407650.1 hypothetical protein [Sphingobacterium faecale]